MVDSPSPITTTSTSGDSPVATPRISIVTVVFNGARSIAAAMDSFATQNWSNKEHLVIDGQSTDGTVELIRGRDPGPDVFVTERDNGMYDALNKGVLLATGDVIGMLHADDLFYDSESLSKVAAAFADPNVDAVYGDLIYVDQKQTDRIIRYWKSGVFDPGSFRRGWMPPHPTVFVRRSVYLKLGEYRTDMGTAADYEWLVRLFYCHRINAAYVPEILVRMRVGGQSNASLAKRWSANRGDQQAWIANGLKPPFGLRLTKPLRKLPQYFLRPS